MNLEELSDTDLKELLDTKNWQLEIESAKTKISFSEDRPYGSIIEEEYTDLYEELIDDIYYIEDEILTRECENMLR
jgi:hypothetical protein